MNTADTLSLPLIRRFTAIVFISLLLTGCHGHLKHIDGPGHSEDAPGQQKKH